MKSVYNTAVIRRFMSSEEFDNFDKRYEAAKKSLNYNKLELTNEDIEMVAAFKRGVDMKEIIKQYNTTHGKVLSRVAEAVRKGLV